MSVDYSPSLGFGMVSQRGMLRTHHQGLLGLPRGFEFLSWQQKGIRGAGEGLSARR